MRIGLALENQTLHHMHHDIAAESARRGLAEGDMRGNRPVEVFFDNSGQPFLDMGLQGGTGVDLMSRDANIHRGKISFFPRSEEHTSEIQSLMGISYAAF